MDEFGFKKIARIQTEILEHLSETPDDVGHKIAALRSAADLMQAAVSMAAITASMAAAFGPKR